MIEKKVTEHEYSMIETIFQELKKRKLCNSLGDLSTNWFQCSKPYVYSMRNDGREPAIAEWMVLFIKLQDYHQLDLAESVFEEVCRLARAKQKDIV